MCICINLHVYVYVCVYKQRYVPSRSSNSLATPKWRSPPTRGRPPLFWGVCLGGLRRRGPWLAWLVEHVVHGHIYIRQKPECTGAYTHISAHFTPTHPPRSPPRPSPAAAAAAAPPPPSLPRPARREGARAAASSSVVVLLLMVEGPGGCVCVYVCREVCGGSVNPTHSVDPVGGIYMHVHIHIIPTSAVMTGQRARARRPRVTGRRPCAGGCCLAVVTVWVMMGPGIDFGLASTMHPSDHSCVLLGTGRDAPGDGEEPQGQHDRRPAGHCCWCCCWCPLLLHHVSASIYGVGHVVDNC